MLREIFHQPWFNLEGYTTTQGYFAPGYDKTGLILNIIGCVFWVIAYAVIVRNIIRWKFVEMPFFIACANIGWEFVWGFIYHPDAGKLVSIEYIGGFLLDCFIFYSLMRYGLQQPMPDFLRKIFRPFLVLNLLFWICFSILMRNPFTDMNGIFHPLGYDTGIGATSGFILNVLLSSLCIIMLQCSKDVSKISLVVGYSKMLGSGLISVGNFIFYPDDHFLQFLCGCTFILDNTYNYLLAKRKGRWI